MPCCNTGLALKEEYDRALKFEAVTYARLIAHKRRHDRVQLTSRGVHYMRMVDEITKRYEEGDAEPLGEVPPA